MQSGRRSNLGGAVWRSGIFRFDHPDPLAFRHLNFVCHLGLDIRDLLFDIATPRQAIFHQDGTVNIPEHLVLFG
jgi:hypothetical protein